MTDATAAQVCAILKAADMAATISWYQAAGFELRGCEPDAEAPMWCELARDGLVLQFLGGDETPWAGAPTFTGCFYVHPAKGVDAVHAELTGAIPAEWGVEIRPWGARELTLRDPNGYFITFTEPDS
jgi:hypothetical protein